MSEIRAMSELSTRDLAACDRANTVVFIAIGALEWATEGDLARLGEWEDYPLKLASACAQKLPERWRSLLLVAPALCVQSATGEGAHVKGYVLRDYLVETCRSLNEQGFRHFVALSSSLAPRQLTAIEEAGKSLRSRTRLEFWKRATRPRLMSASSVLVSPVDQKRSLFRYQPSPRDRVVPNEARLREQAGEIAPKLIAALEGADPNRLFRSWYSLVPTNQSFFRAWALSLAFFCLMILWFYVGVQGLFGQ